MDSWEDFEDEQVIAVAEGAFGHADDDENVLESWEDEEETPASTAASAPAKKKKNLTQIIAERNEAEEKRQKELMAKKAAMEAEMQEDPAVRRARLAKLQEEADLQNAADLFGNVKIQPSALESSSSSAAVAAISDDSFERIQPATKQELDNFASLVASKIVGLKVKASLKVPFMEKLFRESVEGMDYTDIRKLSSILSTVSNDKQRIEKEKKSGKKGSTKKAQVKMAANEIESEFANNDLADYDDFM